MNKKWIPHAIAVAAFAVFIVLGLACATKVTGPITYSDEISVPMLTQEELFTKARGYFYEASRSPRSIIILMSEQSSGIIKGRLVVDNIQYGDELRRYNSIFTVEVFEGNYRITFADPTIQNIGFVSPLARERSFRAYLTGNRAATSALSPLTSNMLMPSNSNINQTEAEIRAEWASKYDFSPSRPGPETPAQYDYQAEAFNEQWLKLATELKRFIMVD